MKKLTLIVAALLMTGMVFAQKSADGKASPASAGSVNATWEWNKTPKGKIGESDTTFSKAYEIAPVEGSKGAKFEVIKGTCKFKTEPNFEGKSVTAIYHGTKNSATLENIEKTRKAEYAITLADAATLELTVTGNGFGEEYRLVTLKNGEDVILYANCLNKENPDEVLTFANAPKGTYRLLLNGARIVKIKAHN